MQTKFKRHQRVILLKDPDPEYIEYHPENEDEGKEIPIKKGMKGKINIILPNGTYHVLIETDDGKPIAYVQVDEDSIKEV